MLLGRFCIHANLMCNKEIWEKVEISCGHLRASSQATYALARESCSSALHSAYSAVIILVCTGTFLDLVTRDPSQLKPGKKLINKKLQKRSFLCSLKDIQLKACPGEGVHNHGFQGNTQGRTLMSAHTFIWTESVRVVRTWFGVLNLWTLTSKTELWATLNKQTRSLKFIQIV